jgi:hypothetical protein
MENATTGNHVSNEIELSIELFLASRLRAVILCEQHPLAIELPGERWKTLQCLVNLDHRAERSPNLAFSAKDGNSNPG